MINSMHNFLGLEITSDSLSLAFAFKQARKAKLG